MIAILFSWIVISFVTLSFGHILVDLFNKMSNRKEQYNFVDTFLLGMCLLTITLSVSSIWLPSNQYILFAYIGLSFAYWLFNKPKLLGVYNRIKGIISAISLKNRLFIGVSVVAFIFYLCWVGHIFDAVYYHYQHIRWNEEYAVVPGLGNLESRFGFNSNYLLICAIFTFRFLFGEAIYTFHSLFALLVMCWIFVELVRSNYELKRIILLILYFLFFVNSVDSITDTSTDIMPNLCVFYLVARFVLYSDIFKNSSLLYFLVPVSLVTFKISTAPFCIIGLFILLILIKQKDFKTLVFFILIALSVVVPWIVRTTIITGYLLYPLAGLDLLSFDWKIAKPVVEYEASSIKSFAFDHGILEFVTFRYFRLYGFMVNKVLFIRTLFMLLIFAMVALSPILVVFRRLKNKQISNNSLLVYITLLIYIAYWFVLAPDFRFASGVFFGITFLIISYMLSEKEKYYPRFAETVMILFASIMLISSFKRTFNYYKLLYPTSILEGRTSMFSVIYIPYSSKNQAEARRIPQNYSTYQMGAIGIFITPDVNTGICYDVIPATSLVSLKRHTRGPDISTIEARGTRIQDGFRPKIKTE